MDENIAVGLEKQYIEKVIDNAIEIIRRMIQEKLNRDPRTIMQLLLDANNSAQTIIETLFEILRGNPSETRIAADFQLKYSKGNFSISEEKLFLDAITNFLNNAINNLNETEIPESSLFVSAQESRKIIEQFFEQKHEVLRIKIGGSWNVADMILFCQSLESLTICLTELILTADNNIHPMDFRLRRYLLPSPKIKKIKYASPGVFDMLGIGKVFEELNNLFQKIIFWKRNLRLQKLDLADKEIGSLVNIWEKIEKLEIDEVEKSVLKSQLKTEVHKILKFFERDKITGSALLLDENKED